MQASFIHRQKPDNALRDLVISQNINSYLEVVSSSREPQADLSNEEIIYHACYGPKDGMVVLHFIVRSVMKDEAVAQWTREAILDAINSYAALNSLVELMMVHKRPFENIFESPDSLLKEAPQTAGFEIDELDF